MSRLVLSLFVASLILSAGLAEALPFGGGKKKPNLFKPEEVATPALVKKNARKYWKASGLGKIREAGYTRVAITEFTVEYVTMQASDWSGKGNFGLLDVAQLASGAGRHKFEFTEEFKGSLPGRLHDRLSAQLAEAGYEVMSLEDVSGSAAYQGFAGRTKLDKNRSSSKYKSEKSEVHSAEGLMDMKSGGFSIMKNMKAEAQLLRELDVDVGLHVHVKVGTAKKGFPAIEQGSTITVSAGVNAAKMPNGNERLFLDKTGTISSKDGFFYPVKSTKKKGRGATTNIQAIDEVVFEEKLMEMFTPYMGMAVSMLDQKGS